MAKKIYMKTLDSQFVASINRISDITLISATVLPSLQKSVRDIQKEIDYLEGMSLLGGIDTSLLVSKKADLETAKQKVSTLNSWLNGQLYDHKSGKGKSASKVEGLYSSIGVNDDLLQAWLDAKSSNQWTKWVNAIKKWLFYTAGMALDDKLALALCKQLEHSISATPSKAKDIKDGVLMVNPRLKAFQVSFTRTFTQYASQTNDKVVIPTDVLYECKVEFSADCKSVINWSVVSRDLAVDESDITVPDTHTETEAETVAESVSEAVAEAVVVK